MLLVFVHGWSVTDTETYGYLPEALAAQGSRYGLDIQIRHVWLGRYISFHDEVSLADISRAFDRALRDQIPGAAQRIAEFSCITHSTGGPVVRDWLDRFYGTSKLRSAPLRHLVMLAPANHGSALAALGKKRVGRLKSWFGGVEPGQRVLDWLSLGSQGQIDLQRSFVRYKPAGSGFFPFVLTGQTIDKKMYDFINSYLVEPGSDGVVRVAAANLNYAMVRLVEAGAKDTVTHGAEALDIRMLRAVGNIRRPQPVALGVIEKASHSGEKLGIMRSITKPDSRKQQVGEILKCLKVANADQYAARSTQLRSLTKRNQQSKHKYVMLVFVVKDDQGDPVDDYDLFLLGGEHSPDKLSKGFFVDRQQNAQHENHLVYYIDHDIVSRNKLTGFRIIPRPTVDDGFSYYHPVEYRPASGDLAGVVRPNETFYVEVELKRCVDQNVFRLDNATNPRMRKKGIPGFHHETRHDFKKVKPARKPVG